MSISEKILTALDKKFTLKFGRNFLNCINSRPKLFLKSDFCLRAVKIIYNRIKWDKRSEVGFFVDMINSFAAKNLIKTTTRSIYMGAVFEVYVCWIEKGRFPGIMNIRYVNGLREDIYRLYGEYALNSAKKNNLLNRLTDAVNQW
jgi:hypothetical protein